MDLENHKKCVFSVNMKSLESKNKTVNFNVYLMITGRIFFTEPMVLTACWWYHWHVQWNHCVPLMTSYVRHWRRPMNFTRKVLTDDLLSESWENLLTTYLPNCGPDWGFLSCFILYKLFCTHCSVNSPHASASYTNDMLKKSR